MRASFRRTLRFAAACGMASVLLACGGGDPSPAPVEPGGSAASTPAAATADMGQRRKALQVDQNPLIADAGTERTIYTGTTATLHGTVTSPDAAAIVTWSWQVVGSPEGSTWTLSGGDSPDASFTPGLAGDYLISLQVVDAFLGASVPVTVTVHALDNMPPVAVATANPISGVVPLMVCFDGSQSSDPEGGPLNFLWTLGDGGATATAATVCHIYQQPGEYKVSVAVTDAQNASDEEIFVITAQEPVNNPPVAAPTATPNSGSALLNVQLAATSGSAPLGVQFAANATDADKDPLTYAWDFGDPTSSDNTSMLADPSHTYAQPGTYTVTLSVSDYKSTSPLYSMTISVESPITMSVRTASLTYTNLQKTMGLVTLWADLDTTLELKPDDVLAASMDGVPLFSLKFSEFRKGLLPGAYLYLQSGLLVRLDVTNHQLFVVTPKIDVADIHNTNGVAVQVTVAGHAAPENIPMRPVLRNTLFYLRPAHVPSPGAVPSM